MNSCGFSLGNSLRENRIFWFRKMMLQIFIDILLGQGPKRRFEYRSSLSDPSSFTGNDWEEKREIALRTVKLTARVRKESLLRNFIKVPKEKERKK